MLDHDEIRRHSLELQARGALREAWLERRRLDPAADHFTHGDFDFLLRCLVGLGDFAEAGRLISDHGSRWEGDANYLNLAAVVLIYLGRAADALVMLQRALEIAPGQPVIWQNINQCHYVLGDLPSAVHAGEQTLLCASAIAGESSHRLPPGPPPRFDPNRPERNVIAFSLWGDNPRYLHGAIRNAAVVHDLFPGWSCRFYCADSTSPRLLAALRGLDAQVVTCAGGQSAWSGLFWRFRVANDPEVDRFLVRDIDSVLGVRDYLAVREWLQGDRWFHLIRDSVAQPDLVLAGLWGGVAGVLPDLDALYRETLGQLGQRSDQDFLGLKVWPIIRQSCLIHDRFFRVFDAHPLPRDPLLPDSDLYRLGTPEIDYRPHLQLALVGGVYPAGDTASV